MFVEHSRTDYTNSFLFLLLSFLLVQSRNPFPLQMRPVFVVRNRFCLGEKFRSSRRRKLFWPWLAKNSTPSARFVSPRRQHRGNSVCLFPLRLSTSFRLALRVADRFLRFAFIYGEEARVPPEGGERALSRVLIPWASRRGGIGARVTHAAPSSPTLSLKSCSSKRSLEEYFKKLACRGVTHSLSLSLSLSLLSSQVNRRQRHFRFLKSINRRSIPPIDHREAKQNKDRLLM